jgi:hypothetical protein
MNGNCCETSGTKRKIFSRSSSVSWQPICTNLCCLSTSYVTIFAIKRSDIDGRVTGWPSVQTDIKTSCVVQLTARKTAYCMNQGKYRCQSCVSLVFARRRSGRRSQLSIHPRTTAVESRGLLNDSSYSPYRRDVIATWRQQL